MTARMHCGMRVKCRRRGLLKGNRSLSNLPVYGTHRIWIKGKINARLEPFIWGNNLPLTVCWRRMLTLPMVIVLKNSFMLTSEHVCLMRPEKVHEFKHKLLWEARAEELCVHPLLFLFSFLTFTRMHRIVSVHECRAGDCRMCTVRRKHFLMDKCTL